MTQTIFDNSKVHTQEDNSGGNEDNSTALEQLVGDDKKFNDTESLAKGKLESDNHISNLEHELSGIREELNKRLSMEEILGKIKEENVIHPKENNESNQSQSSDSSQEQNQSNNENIQDIVKQYVLEENNKKTLESNVSKVQSELVTKYGSDYVNVIDKVRKELGVEREYMDQLAASNPAVFMRIVSGSSASKDSSLSQAPLNSSVNSSSQTRKLSSGKSYSDYQSMLRSDNPKEVKRYWSAEVQQQMHKDAIEQGDSFYN